MPWHSRACCAVVMMEPVSRYTCMSADPLSCHLAGFAGSYSPAGAVVHPGRLLSAYHLRRTPTRRGEHHPLLPEQGWRLGDVRKHQGFPLVRMHVPTPFTSFPGGRRLAEVVGPLRILTTPSITAAAALVAATRRAIVSTIAWHARHRRTIPQALI